MKKFLILLLSGIILIPLSSGLPLKIISSNPWANQYIMLLLFIFMGTVFLLWDFDKFLSVFVSLCLFSTIFISKLNPRAILLFFQFSLAALASYGISKFNKRARKYICLTIFSLVLIQFIWIILQYFNIDPLFYSIYDKKLDEMVGFTGAKDQLGTFFALTLPTVFSILPTFILISFIGLIISKSSFAFVSAIIGYWIFYSLLTKKIINKILLVITIVSLFFFLKAEKISSTDFQMRIDVWKFAAKSVVTGKISTLKGEVKCNPLFGYGFGNFMTLFPYVSQKEANNKFNYADEKFTHAHNDYIETPVFELGYSGIIAFILLLISFICQFIKTTKTNELILYFSSIIIYLLNSMGNFLSQMAVSGFLLIIFYGMYKAVIRENGANSLITQG